MPSPTSTSMRPPRTGSCGTTASKSASAISSGCEVNLARHSGTRFLARARNPYSRSWLWIPGSRYARPGMTVKKALFPIGKRGAKSQPQHRLGDDVALDLVGAAVDRDLAVVEIARRDLRGPLHGFVRAVLAMHVVGRSERADHF